MIPFSPGNPTLAECPAQEISRASYKNDIPSQLHERESERAGNIYIYSYIRACTLSTHSRALAWPGPAPADLLLYYCEAQAARIQSLCAPPARVSIFLSCVRKEWSLKYVNDICVREGIIFSKLYLKRKFIEHRTSLYKFCNTVLVQYVHVRAHRVVWTLPIAKVLSWCTLFNEWLSLQNASFTLINNFFGIQYALTFKSSKVEGILIFWFRG